MMKDFIARNHLLIFAIICAFALIFYAEYVRAIDIDPNIKPTATLSCDLPVTREDGSPFDPAEIEAVTFFRSTDNSSWEVQGMGPSCEMVVDATALPDGTYYYTATVRDVNGLESIFATPSAELVVKRLTPPAAPTLRWVEQ